MTLDVTIPEEIPERHRDALQAQLQRLERALAARDVEQIVGTAKDWVEAVAKVVLDLFGWTYSSGDSVLQLATRAQQAMELHPRAFQGRPPLQDLLQSLLRIASALAELRNRDGTGHGRSETTDLVPANARVAAEAALAWVRWILAHLHDHLTLIQETDEVAEEIEVSRVFRSGQLASLLESIGLVDRSADQQRVIGVAVGRRAASGTIVADRDVLLPLATREAWYPEEFVVGALEGILIGRGGYIRTVPSVVNRIPGLMELLGDRGADVLREIADRAESAELSYGFERRLVDAIVEALESAADSLAENGSHLIRVSDRVRTLSS